MAGEPVVSIIMPIYNGEHFLGGAVDSLRNQDFSSWEIVAIDDGSTDQSWNVLMRLAQSEERIRVVQNEGNLGLAATMNKAVGLCSGRYIAIQEQDDFSAPSRLSREVAFLNDNPQVGLVSGIALWLNDDLEPTSKFPGILAHGGQYPQSTRKMFRYLYLEQCKVVNAGCMFRRSVLDDWDQPFNERAKMSVDWEFFLRLARNHLIWGLHEVVVRMRRGRNHTSLTKYKLVQFNEARRCINAIYRDYRHADENRVSRWLWQQALSNQCVLEARYYAQSNHRAMAIKRLLEALILNPANHSLWRTAKELGDKAIRKVSRR